MVKKTERESELNPSLVLLISQLVSSTRMDLYDNLLVFHAKNMNDILIDSIDHPLDF